MMKVCTKNVWFLFVIAFVFGSNISVADELERISPARDLPSFSLVDQHGESFEKSSLTSGWSMIFIGFTACPDVCPMTLSNLEAVRADMGVKMSPDSIPNIIFLAVDPARDKVGLAEYLSFFHPRYVGVTGEVSEVDKLVAGLDGFYRLKKKSDADTNYDVLHTAKVSIINPKGQLVAQMTPPFKPESTGEQLTQLIRWENRRLAKEQL